MFKVKVNKTILKITEKEPLTTGSSKLYDIFFEFDDSWNTLVKTAIFKAGEISVNQLLENDHCELPWEVLQEENADQILWVGAYGTDMSGIKLPTVWGQLGTIQQGAMIGGTEAKEPSPSVVAQIYNTAKSAEEKVESTLALTKNIIEESSINAEEAKEAKEKAEEAEVAAESSALAAAEAAEEAQAAAESITSALETGVSNALHGTKTGSVISADDVSPLVHPLSVRVSSKNMIPFPYVGKSGTQDGLTYTVNDDRSITVKGTATAAVNFVCANASSGIELRHGVTYSLSGGDGTYNVAMAYRLSDGTYKYLSNGRSITWDDNYTFVHIYYNFTKGKEVDTTLSPPQFEIGAETTPYVPYIDVEGTTITLSDGENEQTATADADGNVSGLVSVSPNMTLTSDTENVIIECEYNRDLMKVIEELTQAIISLGGNI
ncbi:MAG: hypothetical protein IJ303_04040 [Clostridia bacterium]|nr:hypothetical protein [Clostridia bacterium]